METKPKMQIPFLAIVAVVLAVGGGAFLLFPKAAPKADAPLQAAAPAPAEAASNNVKVEEYLQTIEISAKGGYEPKQTVAKANMSTVIKFNTDSTYDCSVAVVIPSLNYHTRLPMTGSVTLDLPPQQPGTELNGMCSMGMYSFKITFAG
jgi:hypothetical protein